MSNAPGRVAVKKKRPSKPEEGNKLCDLKKATGNEGKMGEEKGLNREARLPLRI